MWEEMIGKGLRRSRILLCSILEGLKCRIRVNLIGKERKCRRKRGQERRR